MPCGVVHQMETGRPRSYIAPTDFQWHLFLLWLQLHSSLMIAPFTQSFNSWMRRMKCLSAVRIHHSPPKSSEPHELYGQLLMLYKKVVLNILQSLIVGTCAVTLSWNLQPSDVNSKYRMFFILRLSANDIH